MLVRVVDSSTARPDAALLHRVLEVLALASVDGGYQTVRKAADAGRT